MYILALVHHRSIGMLYEEVMFFCRLDEVFAMHFTLPSLTMFRVLRMEVCPMNEYQNGDGNVLKEAKKKKS